MNKLFADPENYKLPKGIVDVELNDVEAVVLKTMAFINFRLSKTEWQQTIGEILSNTSQYSAIKKSSIGNSIKSLKAKDLLYHESYGYMVDYNIVVKVRSLAKDNKALIKSACNYFSNHYNYKFRDHWLHIALMAGDFKILDKKLHVSESYSWLNSNFELIQALRRAGDMRLIIPMLPMFHKDQKNSLLYVLPVSLRYNYFEQLKDIYLNREIEVPLGAKYVYVSCALLILPVDEVVRIVRSLQLDEYTLFYSTFLKGDTEKALIQAANFLVRNQEENGHKRKELPAMFGLLYALVLISVGGTSNLTAAATFVRSASKVMPSIDNEVNPFKEFCKILLLFINHKLGKQTASSQNIQYTYVKKYHLHFLVAVLKWFGAPMEGQTFHYTDGDKEEFEFRAAGITKVDEIPEYSASRFAELRQKFDFIPLAEIIKPKEVWEDVLNILANEITKTGNSTSNDKKVSKKLIWLVSPLVEGDIRCVEQTKNKNGWNKGKERSLTRMISTCPDFATEEDKKVIACLQKHPYYNEIYIRDWNKLILTLSSHPEVYLEGDPYLPLTIKVVEAQIQIDKNLSGASLKLNPKSPENRIIQDTPTSFIFYNWSAQALKVYNILSDSGLKEIAIPESGISKAKPVFEKLNQVLPVTGNFVENSAKTIESANIPVIQLTPVNDQMHIQLLIEVVENEDYRVAVGIGSNEVLVKTSKGEHLKVKRIRTKEKELLMDLSNRVFWFEEMKMNSAQIFIDDEADILDFLADVKEHAPEIKMIWPKGERLRVVKALSHSDFNVNVKKAQDWFAIDGEVVIDKNIRFNIKQILEGSKGGTQKYIRLDDKTYLSICKDLQKRLATLNAVSQTKGKNLLVHKLGTGNVEQFVEGVENLKTDKSWKQHLKELDELKTYKPSRTKNIQAELRPYQEEGVLWLDRLYNWGVGACLADDMGLGKTIQAISILLKYAKKGASVVVAPSSVCHNWIKELNRFAPTLNPVVFRSKNREDVLGSLQANDVLILSYGLLQANPDLLEKYDWNIAVLDEAHAIKNSKSVRSKAVMKIKAQFRIITTGTPIQNHLGELWNLFQFINPGMLGSSEQFAKKYMKNNNPEESQQLRKSLSKYIAPFILRRNKNEVLDDLPEKTEITLQVPLSEQENAMYEELRQEAMEQLSGTKENGGAKHIEILAHITKLRQMSCNPQLVVPDCSIQSSKLEALERLVDDLINAGHKALIFSQFTKHLALIREMLDKKGISYQYLDGSTPLKHREKSIDKFQSGKSDLFLISLKAGGVGLNLTAADYVIHMDPWWNPAIEDQASDRAHRIGQQRPVTIYRIIAENTIEEKIVKMHHNKRDLANKLLADTDQSAKISSEELMALITDTER